MSNETSNERKIQKSMEILPTDFLVLSLACSFSLSQEFTWKTLMTFWSWYLTMSCNQTLRKFCVWALHINTFPLRSRTNPSVYVQFCWFLLLLIQVLGLCPVAEIRERETRHFLGCRWALMPARAQAGGCLLVVKLWVKQFRAPFWWLPAGDLMYAASKTIL